MQKLKIKDKYTTIEVKLGNGDVTITEYIEAFEQALLGLSFNKDLIQKTFKDIYGEDGGN